MLFDVTSDIFKILKWLLWESLLYCMLLFKNALFKKMDKNTEQH